MQYSVRSVAPAGGARALVVHADVPGEAQVGNMVGEFNGSDLLVRPMLGLFSSDGGQQQVR